MPRLLSVSDHGLPTGYGRIADSVCTRLVRRGWDVLGTSFYYDGLLPAQYEGQSLPYHVAVLAGKPNWVEEVGKLLTVWQPDIVMCTQDFPYAQGLFYAPYDWSRFGRVIITPVDGVPIDPDWLALMAQVDAGLTISQFGVGAFRSAGLRVRLCRPGIDLDKFYPMTPDERAGLRAKMGITPDAFVFGSMCMNQGRKAIPLMLRAFFDFASDKPTARYLLDMDKVSPAGWNIPNLCKQQGWDTSKLLFREDAIRAGLPELRQRYNLLDAHAVIAHREGYGLPISEAMACGVVSMALDYCSGPEQLSDGRGVLVKTTGYNVPGTWGGAQDEMPDMADFVAQLHRLHDYPDERHALARRGMEWARQQTWDRAADAVQETLNEVLEKRKGWQAAPAQPSQVAAPLVQAQPDGQRAQTVELVEVAR